MFRLDHPWGTPRSTFRLQLFKAKERRPVAVVTQVIDEGELVINGAESCAEAVWHAYVPDEAEPPIWVQRLLTRYDDDGFKLVLFDVVGGQRLQAPRWRALSDSDVDLLVGQSVDRERGIGYDPWPMKQVEDTRRYAAARVADLPRPQPYRAACMSPGTPGRLLAGEGVPSRDGRDCCWYHGGDWHRVSAIAIRLALSVQSAGVPFQEIPAHVPRRAMERLHLSGWERKALDSLLHDPVKVTDERRDRILIFINGQHRVQAMLDAGVQWTLVERY
ncbi:hypothetical protein JNW88_10695 [Micromonospora sp. ATA32]|nr:hypothetical protein [Micromonospora sp. ATA32]